MDMKKYLFIAASALALASCSSEDFVGTEGGNVENGANKAINFSGNAGKITRATTSNTGTPQAMLGYQFKVYGVKKMSKNGGDKFEPSFTNYSVWYDDAKNTTSNKNGWEYVGNENTSYGPGKVTFKGNQYIKYWDYAADEYHFVAGSPISAFTYNYNPDADKVGMKIPSATITGLAGHINVNNTETALKAEPVYVATPIVVKKENYQNPVIFEFNRQQAMVRVGIYETIPGYSITEIKFYEADEKEATSNNVILTSATPDYFVGGKGITGTVKYDWTKEKPSYTFEYTDNTQLTKSQNWYAGLFELNSPLATTSTETVATLYGKDNDMSDKGYFTVLPTPSATQAAPILIKCDYTLTADDHLGETIKVTGATAAIPAAFSKWEVNTRYTYLFKISQNTNGYTGNDPNKAGLYPITFDAVVKASTDAMQGTVTTVSTPSITTYQDGSVTDASVEYKAGKAIYATATDKDGKEIALTTNGTAVGNVQVYELTTERNEADLQVPAIASVEFKDGNKVPGTAVPTTDATVGNVTLTANKYLSFTPTKKGYYAIQYLLKAQDGDTPAVYTYKVVYVEAATK